MMNGHHGAVDQVTLAGFALTRKTLANNGRNIPRQDFPLVKFSGPEGL
jgi:hypothetical protein